MASFLRSKWLLLKVTSSAFSRSIHTGATCNIPRLDTFSTHKRRTVTVIPGDGVGPELCENVKSVFTALGFPVDFEEHYLSELTPGPSTALETVIESLRRNRVGLKGIIATPKQYSGAYSNTLNMVLRENLDLFANVVRGVNLPGLVTRHKNIDIVLIREQTEGEFSGVEHESVPGVVESLKLITRENSLKIAKVAFDYATRHGRRKVTAVHKANIMKLGDGLFLSCCAEVAELYPKIEFDSIIIDNCCMQLVSNPHQFDVVVLPNLYGNILDNLLAGLIGGAGVLPGESYSHDIAVFEPGARHPYAQAVGKNIANPTALLLCAANMLNHINFDSQASLLRDSVLKVIRLGKIRTPDMGGFSHTNEFTQAVIETALSLLKR